MNITRKEKGQIAQAKVIAYLVENHFSVFIPLDGNDIIDLIANRCGVLSKISVKYTSQKMPSGAWHTELRSVSRRKDNKVAIKKFINSEIDILAVYIAPMDKVVVFRAAGIPNSTSLDINLN